MDDNSTEEEPRICQKGGKGQLLPLLGDWEVEWPARFKAVVYMVGLMYFFLGVSIVAEMFMSAIERITSKKRVTRVPGTKNRFVTTTVWNTTVANLTLMALGSSAPEILLSINDIYKRQWFSGKLGPSTIVGSAAFNLFVIIAVCVNSVPDGEVRQIREMGAFVITAIFSLFAYIWVLFIVNFNSTYVIDVWEGVATFLFFPLLVLTSYLVDVGTFSRANLRAVLGRYLQLQPDVHHASTDNLLFRACRCCCCRRREVADDEECAVVENFDPDAPLVDENGEPLWNEAGILTFNSDTVDVLSGAAAEEHTVTVFRKNGTSGRVTSKFRTEMLNATPSYDYIEKEGELVFRDGISTVDITFTVLPKLVGEQNDSFQIVLEDATGGLEFNPDSDGGPDRCCLTVNIINSLPTDGRFHTRVIVFLDSIGNLSEVKLGFVLWWTQIKDAIHVTTSEHEGPTVGEYVMHCVWFPWQFLFALFTPPPTFIGGWVCFYASLGHIAWLTVIVGDLAELFGCAADIDDEITAITFVALGTSVPDLFASRTAAVQDEWADASIVNVTGSNSVNVFLGIGLPWMGAAIYWAFEMESPLWVQRYGGQYEPGSFVVEGGNLAYSVAVFTLMATACLTAIGIRRYFFGGELGGPSDSKAYSSFFLFLLWACYITLSIWKISTKNEDIVYQVISVVFGLLLIVVMMIGFAFFRKLLKISKNYIGEEGFWGIFVAFLIIGGRILFFIVFQYQWESA